VDVCGSCELILSLYGSVTTVYCTGIYVTWE